MTHMARAHRNDTCKTFGIQRGSAGDDRNRSAPSRATATTVIRAQAIPERKRTTPIASDQPFARSQSQRLDIKALRLAVHGWWLGNPLAYKPGAADLRAVARELASAGAVSGTLVLSDLPTSGSRQADAGEGALSDAKAVSRDTVQAVLILRPPLQMPRIQLSAVAAKTVAEVAGAALGRPCALRGRQQVILGDGGNVASHLCSLSVEQSEEVTLIDMHFALCWLWKAAEVKTDQPSTALFARSDWREVFLARVLHALDGRRLALSRA